MHLLGPWMTTTKYNRKKNKRTPSERELQSRSEHDKWLKKMGAHPSQRTKTNTNAGNKIPNYREHQGTAQCSNNVIGSTAKKPEQQYTGDQLAGIGMLHKSNMVPVRKDSNDAKEIARMRRG
jgi:hypothetical protein